MSNRNCDACSNLLTDNAEFATNGTTATVQESLKENTGFNPNLTVLHTDCEDLNDANDCLIGNMIDEVDAYDVCDLRTYIKKFTSNLYELLKAIIAAICGLWEKVEELLNRSDNACAAIDELVATMVGGMANIKADTTSSKFTWNGGEPHFDWAIRQYKGCDNTSKHIFNWGFGLGAAGCKLNSSLSLGEVIATWNDATIKNKIGDDAYNAIKDTPGFSAMSFWVANSTLVGCILGHNKTKGVWELSIETICGSASTGAMQVIHISPLTTIY